MTTIFRAKELIAPVANEPTQGMADALLSELGDLMRRFLDTGEHGSIDLLKLPISPTDLLHFKDRLGRGEVSISVEAGGGSEIYETAYAGLWWVEHRDELSRVIARLIEAADAPSIVLAHREDLEATAKTLIRSEENA